MNKPIQPKKYFLGQPVPDYVLKSYENLVIDEANPPQLLSLEEFEERFLRHENGLENAEGVQITMLGKDVLALQERLKAMKSPITLK
jgi:hypothetical protein